MESALKNTVLIEQMNYLCEELGDPGRYFPYLRSKGILDSEDCQKIRSEITSKEKTTRLVETIRGRQSGRGEEAFDVLVDALKKQRVQAHIARQLQKALAKLKADKELEKGVEKKSAPVLKKPPDETCDPMPPNVGSTSDHRSQFEVHPDHGPLPPPPDMSPHPTDSTDGGSAMSAEYGPLPPLAPATTRETVAAQQATPNNHIKSSVQVPHFPHNITKTSDCELGPQSLSEVTSDSTMNSCEDQLQSFDTLTTPSYQSGVDRESIVDRQQIRDLQLKLGDVTSKNKEQSIRIKELVSEVDELRRVNRELEERLRVLGERPSSLPMSVASISGKHSPLTSHDEPSHMRPFKVSLSTLSTGTYHSPHSHGGLLEHRLSANSNENISLKSANSNSSINSYGSKNSYTLPTSASESLV